MKIHFLLNCPPEYAEVFEQSVGQGVSAEHCLTRDAAAPGEYHYTFEAEVERAFFQVGILVAEIYKAMEKREVGTNERK